MIGKVLQHLGPALFGALVPLLFAIHPTTPGDQVGVFLKKAPRVQTLTDEGSATPSTVLLAGSTLSLKANRLSHTPGAPPVYFVEDGEKTIVPVCFEPGQGALQFYLHSIIATVLPGYPVLANFVLLSLLTFVFVWAMTQFFVLVLGRARGLRAGILTPLLP